MSRIPDVGNPWLDAGIVPFSTMGYNRDRQYWEKWFPADFVTESFPGQFRNWFYAMLAMSTMMVGRAPFKVLLGHGQVRDQWGEEMHKSLGNAIPFEGAADTGYKVKDKTGKFHDYPPMSADLIRWMFCRHNSALNINFGPGPAEEVRKHFTLKLWNSYAFLCNYAQADRIDPTAPQVPVSRRPDIDRWVLSDLQHLIASARRAFENYRLMDFCLEVERFVDDKLSNWYIRRNRRRFWKKRKREEEEDKLAAYQTLHTVVVTLAKLVAPIMPFLSEVMYRNLVPAGAGEPESVHLCDYPQVDTSLVDERLSEEMEALLELVSLGLSARQTAKRKVRQPLAELRVQPGSDCDRRAVERFGDQLCDELNVKKAGLHDPSRGPLLVPDVKPNLKSLGPKFAAALNEVIAALKAAPAAEVAAKVQAGGPFELRSGNGTVTLEPGDVILQQRAAAGWAGAADHKTQVAIDTLVTEELASEGLGREVIRHVQEQRKNANLEMQDHIVRHLRTASDALRQAIERHRGYIADETLTDRWSATPLDEQAHTATVTIDGQELTIQLQRLGKLG